MPGYPLRSFFSPRPIPAEQTGFGSTTLNRMAGHWTISEPRSFTETVVGNLRTTFYTLLGAVGFVLLIACANVASLFLGRLAARHKEIALRQSLGATRATIVRQFLVESLLFSAAAGALPQRSVSAAIPLVRLGTSYARPLVA